MNPGRVAAGGNPPGGGHRGPDFGKNSFGKNSSRNFRKMTQLIKNNTYGKISGIPETVSGIRKSIPRGGDPRAADPPEYDAAPARAAVLRMPPPRADAISHICCSGFGHVVSPVRPLARACGVLPTWLDLPSRVLGMRVRRAVDQLVVAFIAIVF